MKHLFALLISVVMTIPLALYRAYWLTVLWGLSAVQYYSSPEMTLGQGLTITALMAFAMIGWKEDTTDKKSYTDIIVGSTVKTLLLPPFTVATFWLVSKFI